MVPKIQENLQLHPSKLTILLIDTIHWRSKELLKLRPLKKERNFRFSPLYLSIGKSKNS